MKAHYTQYFLQFKRPGGTSRGVLHQKETFILHLTDGEKTGIGECALFRGLSSDDTPNYEEKLKWLCQNINLSYSEIKTELAHYPSLWFGYEQAILNLKHGGNLYFPSPFTQKKKSITINGLIWMGDVGFMKEQIQQKLADSYHCIKIKIGTRWLEEKKIIQELRKDFPKEQLELRVDANGAFTEQGATKVLQELAELQIHSIEQPIKAGNWEAMARLCQHTPTPIALDEELIGINIRDVKKEMLSTIRPQYIILKPALAGGFSGSDEWIEIAESLNIKWWITSALESNIGLNAIAQYTATKNNAMPQGLGTGSLFTNNFDSALQLVGEQLHYQL